MDPVDLAANRGSGAAAADIVTRTVAWIIVALRFFARHKAKTYLWWDDWLILAAAIVSVGGLAVDLLEVQLGGGRHLEYVLQTTPENLPSFIKLQYADENLYPPIIGPTKLSILALYVRLFGIRKNFAILCYVEMGMVILWTIITEAVFIFQCNPVYLGWSISREGGTCFAYQPLFIGTNAVDVILDFIILITPIYVVWQLQLPTKKRILVIGVMALGGGACVFSSLRLAIVSQLTFEDVTWDNAPALIWSDVEVSIGMICACLPTLGPLVPRAWIGRSSGSNGTTSNSSRNPKYGLRYLKNPNDRHERLDEDVEFANLSTSRMVISRTTEIDVHHQSRGDSDDLEAHAR